MILLAIDTAANLCAACIYDTEKGELARHVLDLGKGHAEHLMTVIDSALQKAGLSFQQLDALAVSVGPGSFTGVRVGVATIRGLALALKIPAIGVSTLEAIAHEQRAQSPDNPIITRIEAGRGQAYLATYDKHGNEVLAPAVYSLAEADILIEKSEPETILVSKQQASADIGFYAAIAAQKLAHHANPPKPKPLYLRDADAKPQTSFALPRKDEPDGGDT